MASIPTPTTPTTGTTVPPNHVVTPDANAPAEVNLGIPEHSKANLSTSWLKKLRDAEASHMLNSVHTEVANLFKLTSADPLSDTDASSMIASLATLDSNAVMIRSPIDDDIMIIHHVATIGGTIVNRNVEHFGLFGAGPKATPLKFKPEGILAINEAEVPCWDTLKKVTTTDEVAAARDVNGTATFLTSAMPIPPFLTAALISIHPLSAAKAFVVVCQAVAEFEANKPTDFPSTIPTLKLILPFLWAADHNLISSVPTAPALATAVINKTTALHTLHIEKPTVTFNPTRNNTTNNVNRYDDPSILEQINGKLGQMVQTSILATSGSTPSSSKTKFETRHSANFQALILTGSAAHSAEVITEPCDTAREFFEQKTAAQAKSYLYNKLSIEKHLPIHIPAGLATAAHAGVLFWEDTDRPSNFSFFLVPPQSSNMLSDTADIIALTLKQSDGRGGIDGDDIRRLTKQKIYLPATINELEHHINHGVHILSVIFSERSFIVRQLAGCLMHIKRHQTTYSDLLRHDHKFATRVLFVIDVRTQNFFREAQQGNFDTSPLDFSRMQDDIVHNRTFRASLPSALIAKKRPRDDDDRGGNGYDDANKRSKKFAKNPSVNPEWALTSGESYRTVFHKNREHIPTRTPSSPPVCATFHIKGSCYSGCRFDHDKIIRGTPLYKAFSKWCSDCRSGNF